MATVRASDLMYPLRRRGIRCHLRTASRPSRRWRSASASARDRRRPASDRRARDRSASASRAARADATRLRRAFRQSAARAASIVAQAAARPCRPQPSAVPPSHLAVAFAQFNRLCLSCEGRKADFRRITLTGARNGCACAINCTTGRTSRAVANLSGSRWKMPAPTTTTWRAEDRRLHHDENDERQGHATVPFAPPFLKAGKLLIAPDRKYFAVSRVAPGLAPKARRAASGCTSCS